jgi:L-asparaginase II
LLAASTRSGLIEASFEVGAAAATSDGGVVATWGDVATVFFYRSAVKPFQATLSQEHGAALAPEQMAIACASHGGQPVHVALVEEMLAEVGLGVDDLECPASWPSSRSARDRLVARGIRSPRPVYHNCSGKHAAMLRACVASGWPVAGYTHPDHPLQREVAALLAEVTGFDPEPSGTDGCGVPTFRGTVVSLATAFARLTTDERFAAAATAMRRFPSLLGSNERNDSRVGRWFGGPVKVGAAGVIAAGRHGLGVAVKSRAGAANAAVVALVEALDQLQLLPPVAREHLADVANLPVLGGGMPVGAISAADGPSG